jgi:hypothetical protein
MLASIPASMVKQKLPDLPDRFNLTSSRVRRARPGSVAGFPVAITFPVWSFSSMPEERDSGNCIALFASRQQHKSRLSFNRCRVLNTHPQRTGFLEIPEVN